MTVEQLKENLEWLKSRKEREDKADEVLDALSPDVHAGISGAFTEWEGRFVKALDQCFNDQDWISYWVYDCNFGANEFADSVTEKDGTKTPFRTVEDLYALLNVN